jgi:predicted Holliday junction resolvase-like endonuclease
MPCRRTNNHILLMETDTLLLLLCAAGIIIVVMLIRLALLGRHITARAQLLHEEWRERDLAAVRREETDIARRGAAATLHQWRVGAERDIRRDAVARSQAVIVGKVSEHVAPYLPEFEYNPKDARFIGSPVDFVVFDGLDAGAVQQVVFIEVKSGSSALSTRERQIRDAVRDGRVRWEELRVESATNSHS